MPSSDKNTKARNTQPCSELYLESGGRGRSGNVSQPNVVRAKAGIYRLGEEHGE